MELGMGDKPSLQMSAWEQTHQRAQLKRKKKAPILK